MKRIYHFGFKKIIIIIIIIIKERNKKNRNEETCNKGNLKLESRRHRVKSEKESSFRSY